MILCVSFTPKFIGRAYVLEPIHVKRIDLLTSKYFESIERNKLKNKFSREKKNRPMFFNDFEENMNETIMKVFIVDLHASSFNDSSKLRYYVNLGKLFPFTVRC